MSRPRSIGRNGIIHMRKPVPKLRRCCAARMARQRHPYRNATGGNAVPAKKFSRLAQSGPASMLSTMTAASIDVTNHARIEGLGQAVLSGKSIAAADARWLFHLENSADIFDLLSWANRIREYFKGNKIHLCSIVNVKAGGCSENCRFCAQSALYQTDSPRYGLIEPAAVLAAADEAKANGVTGLGLVAAWRGLEEGPVLDEICERFEELKRSGKARPDASLGIIKDQKVADWLRRARTAAIWRSRSGSSGRMSCRSIS